jgi:hypothetical protein
LASGAPLPGISNPQFTNSVFSTAKGGVTEVLNSDKEGKEGRMIFAVVNNVIPTRNAELAEVQDQVAARYTTDESNRLAAEAAKVATERAHKGESLDAIAKDFGLAVKTAPPFSADGAAEGIGAGSQLGDAFKAKQGDFVGPLTIGSSEFLCRVTDKIPADMSLFAQNKAAIVDSLSQQRQQVQTPLFRDSVVAELTRRGKIKRNEATINRLIGQLQG